MCSVSFDAFLIIFFFISCLLHCWYVVLLSMQHKSRNYYNFVHSLLAHTDHWCHLYKWNQAAWIKSYGVKWILVIWFSYNIFYDYCTHLPLKVIRSHVKFVVNSSVSQYERPRAVGLASSACVNKTLKSSLSLHAKILFYIWNERIKYCKRYHYEINRFVLHVRC